MEGGQSQPRKINILLLGESGAGKSTFINSLANYLEYDSLNEAMRSEIKWKVPARFTVTDENYEEISMSIGNPDMENYSGHIVTKGVTDYEFRHKNVAMHLIDTPPLGDGKSDDNEKNMNKILSFISKLNHINAIAFFLKPNVSILSEYFKGCLNTLLSRLNTSVFKNIVFVFTHTRSTFYKPGETLTILTKVLKEMSVDTKATIPCSKENMFCLDNETFRYLVAYKRGVMTDVENMKVFSQSWKLSNDCCQKFINYVIGDSKTKCLEPFVMQTIRSPKTILATVEELFNILADLSLILHKNMNILDSEEIRSAKTDISLLNLEKVPQNKMVGCLHCMETHKMLRNGNVTFTQFKCFQTEDNYNNEKTYARYLSIYKTVCGNCNCKLIYHKEVFYLKKVYLESISKDKERQIEITKLSSIFDQELEILLGFLAQCQTFRKSASTVRSDLYKDFLQNQLSKNKLKKDEFEALKKRYSKSTLGKQKVLPNDIENKLKTLFDLKYTGQILRNVYKEFLPQNEVFKKQQSVKSPIVKERKLIIYYRPDDDTRKHNVEPETEVENVKKIKLSPESNTEKSTEPDIAAYRKSNKHNSDAARSSVTQHDNFQTDKGKNQHNVDDKNKNQLDDDSACKIKSNIAGYNKGKKYDYDAEQASKSSSAQLCNVPADKGRDKQKVNDDPTNKAKNVANVTASSKGCKDNSEAKPGKYFGSFEHPDVRQQYEIQANEDDNQLKNYGDGVTLETKSNEQEKSCDSRPNITVEHIIYINEERCQSRERLMRKCKMTSNPEEYKGNVHKPTDKSCVAQQDKSSASQASKKDDMNNTNTNNRKEDKQEMKTSHYFDDHNKQRKSSTDLETQTENRKKIFSDNAKSKERREENQHKTDKLGDDHKYHTSCYSSTNLKTQSVNMQNKQWELATDLRPQSEKRDEECLDDIKSQEHINKNQQKSGKVEDNYNSKQDYTCSFSISKNLQSSNDYLDKQRQSETVLQEQSDNWSEEFLNYHEYDECREANKYKTYPTNKPEDNYYGSEQDKSCRQSRATKQSAIDEASDSQKHLDKFQLQKEERKLSDQNIQKMHEECLAIAQGNKELFEKLSNKIDAMEISMNKMKMAIAQAEDEKLDKISQIEKQVKLNAGNIELQRQTIYKIETYLINSKRDHSHHN